MHRRATCNLSAIQRHIYGTTSILSSSAEKIPVCLTSSYSTDFDREYLHHSIIPTYHFQKSLLRLPIPKLELTCERYLRAQCPLLTSEQFHRTEAIVGNFLKTDGPELNNELIATDKRNKHTSYISETWFDMYLKDRASIVLNYNPFITFNNDPRPEYNNQLIRATNMLLSSVRFFKTLRDKYLEPEIFHLNPQKSDTQSFRRIMRLIPESIAFYGAYLYKAFPLDMSQYGRLFQSTRIPKIVKDELVTDTSSKHIAVMKNGHFYIFDVLNAQGKIVPADEVLAHLDYILKENQPPPKFPIGVLTSENRDQWATVRDQLLKAGNMETLKLVDSALFVLALDNHAPATPDDIARTFLHGDGINRWFDKSFTLIVTAGGLTAVNFEHSWGDGVAVLRYFKEVFQDSTRKSQVDPETRPAAVSSSSAVRRLEFKLDQHLQNSVDTAMKKFKESTGRLRLGHVEYQTFNKPYVKKHKLSPDSVMQLAIQMAYYRMYGKTVGTYESCSTAAFKHGRTETVRPCTMDTLAVCKMLFDPSAKTSISELQEALNRCSNSHNQLIKEAAMGQGFDRHLFALKNLAEKQNKKVEMFNDPAYKFINHIILSTSTLSDPSVMFGGFAPVQDDGFGIGYSIEDNRVGFSVTSYPARDVQEFVTCCKLSLDDIYSILNGQLPKRKS